jgi:exoribonuclease R
MEQNRALHGDMVFVELMDPEDEDEKKQEPDDAPPNLVTIDDALTAKVAAVTFQNDDVYTTWQDDTTQMHLWNPTVKVRRAPDFTPAKLDDAIPQRQGRVVHVIAPNIQASSELNPSDDRKMASKKTIVGLLTTMTRGDGTPMYLLTPAKKSLPQFLTPPFFKPQEGDDGMYRAEYVYGSWKEGHNWPPCTNVQFIGRSCNVEDETMALLAEHGVDHGEFEGPVL